MRFSKLPVGRVGAAPLSKVGVGLSDGFCGSAPASRLGEGLGTSVAVLLFASLVGWAPAAATAGRFGLDVVDLAFGAEGSTGASLCATGG